VFFSEHSVHDLLLLLIMKRLHHGKCYQGTLHSQWNGGHWQWLWHIRLIRQLDNLSERKLSSVPSESVVAVDVSTC